MADTLYKILSETQVTREDILEAETLSRQYLKAYYPDLDLREGVALSDLVIRPFATLLSMLKKGMDYYFSSNTIAGITDDSPEEMVDKLMSNWFLTRSQGFSAKVRTRLFFVANTRDIYIPATASFSTDNVTTFRPITDTFISNTALIYDSERDEYYYDLTLVSTSQDESANIESGDFIYHSNIDPFFLLASVLYLESKAIPKETNTQFIDRAQTAISTRNLINDPSIDSLIKQTFNYVTEVIVSGYGDSEMKRDLITVINPVTTNPEDMHIGGKVDIFVNCAVDSEDVELTTNAGSFIEIRAADPLVPGSNIVYDLVRNELVPTDTIPPTEPYTVEVGWYDQNSVWQTITGVESADVGFSSKQYVRIYFTGYPNATATFTIKKLLDLRSIQEGFLENSTYKVVCADYLVRSLDRYEVDINVVKIGGVPVTSDELSAITVALGNHFSALRAGETLVIADLVSVIINDAGISDLDVNLDVSYTLYDRTFKKLLGEPTSEWSGTISSHLECDRTQRFVLGTVTSTI